MTVMPVDSQHKQRVIQLNFCGEICELWADGALYLPSYKTLVVSDLHFEKGHAQSTAAPLPRYDTDMTLLKLSEIVDKSNPQRCIFLGDSFHNAEVAKRLPEAYRQILNDLSKFAFLYEFFRTQNLTFVTKRDISTLIIVTKRDISI